MPKYNLLSQGSTKIEKSNKLSDEWFSRIIYLAPDDLADGKRTLCPFAKKAGCKVIGLAGSKEKCDWLVNDLGFDHAINYKTDDLDKSLKDLCPEGVDIYFDNVAGDILNTVLQNLALYARIPLSGLLAQYNEKGSRLPGPDNFDQILMKRASITGFFCPDFLEDGPKIEKIMHDWYLEGSLKFKADVTNGLENVLVSYKRMFNGDNIGKTLVKL